MRPPTTGGRPLDKRETTMQTNESEDPVARFISDYIDSVESGTPAPNPDDLTPAERAEADDLLARMGGALDTETETEIDIPPIEESSFAADHGIVRRPPAVCVHGDALQRVRETAGLSASEVAAQLTALGVTSDAARITEIEGAASTLMAPRDARRLAAVIGVPLESIEATGEPWPSAERADLDQVGGEHVPVEMGPDLVYLLDGGFYAGVVRCRGAARDLDSVTFRRVAGALLHGEWSHLHAALLVTATTPRKVLVLDAFDCEPRFAAPSGELGYGTLDAAADLDSALDHYNSRFGIKWNDPPAYFARTGAPGWSGLLQARHMQTAAAAIRKSINRYAELKSAGCAVALSRLENIAPDRLDRLVEELNSATDDEGELLVAEMVGTT